MTKQVTELEIQARVKDAAKTIKDLKAITESLAGKNPSAAMLRMNKSVEQLSAKLADVTQKNATLDKQTKALIKVETQLQRIRTSASVAQEVQKNKEIAAEVKRQKKLYDIKTRASAKTQQTLEAIKARADKKAAAAQQKEERAAAQALKRQERLAKQAARQKEKQAERDEAKATRAREKAHATLVQEGKRAQQLREREAKERRSEQARAGKRGMRLLRIEMQEEARAQKQAERAWAHTQKQEARTQKQEARQAEQQAAIAGRARSALTNFAMRRAGVPGSLVSLRQRFSTAAAALGGSEGLAAALPSAGSMASTAGVIALTAAVRRGARFAFGAGYKSPVDALKDVPLIGGFAAGRLATGTDAGTRALNSTVAFQDILRNVGGTNAFMGPPVETYPLHMRLAGMQGPLPPAQSSTTATTARGAGASRTTTTAIELRHARSSTAAQVVMSSTSARDVGATRTRTAATSRTDMPTALLAPTTTTATAAASGASTASMTLPTPNVSAQRADDFLSDMRLRLLRLGSQMGLQDADSMRTMGAASAAQRSLFSPETASAALVGRAYGVGPESVGQLARGLDLRSRGGGGNESVSGVLARTIDMAQRMGFQGAEVADLLKQIAENTEASGATGVGFARDNYLGLINALSTKSPGGASFNPVQAQNMASAIQAGGQQVGFGNLGSGLDILALNTLGGLGGNSSPVALAAARKRLQQQEFKGADLAKFLSTVLNVTGAGQNLTGADQNLVQGEAIAQALSQLTGKPISIASGQKLAEMLAAGQLTGPEMQSTKTIAELTGEATTGPRAVAGSVLDASTASTTGLETSEQFKQLAVATQQIATMQLQTLTSTEELMKSYMQTIENVNNKLRMALAASSSGMRIPDYWPW